MVVDVNNYRVEIIEAINSKFALCNYKNEYLSKSSFKLTSKFGIIILEYNREINSAIIGAENGASGLCKTSFIFDEEKLLICCGDSIFCLEILTLYLKWKTKVDEITAFQLFKIDNGYIVHGELEVCRINNEGFIIWKNSGADIFLTAEADENFEIKDGFITVKDWGNRVYKWNFNGEDIK
jgi:hypothetical protein